MLICYGGPKDGEEVTVMPYNMRDLKKDGLPFKNGVYVFNDKVFPPRLEWRYNDQTVTPPSTARLDSGD